MAVIDPATANVALPTIAREFHASPPPRLGQTTGAALVTLVFVRTSEPGERIMPISQPALLWLPQPYVHFA